MNIYINDIFFDKHSQYLEYIENQGTQGITSLILLRMNDYIRPEEVLLFSNLRDLNISGNYIGNMDLSNMSTNLTNLISYNNKLTELIFPENNRLSILFLTNNLLTNLNYKNLKSLERLCLSENNIKNIDKSISCLENLNGLFLFENKITDITPLENLTNLTTLWIGKNFITSIPDTFFEKVSKLQELCISNNCISLIPDSLTRCTELTFLNIKNNQITNLPKDIGNLRKLKIFEFNNNYIETYPNSFCYLDLEYTNYDIEKIKTELMQTILRNFKKSYYIGKFGKNLERFYIKNIKNKSLYFDLMHVLFSPDYNFYYRFLDKDAMTLFIKN